MCTALDLTEEKMAIYKATAQKRRARRREQLARHRERAWRLARQAADLLKAQFGVSRVVVFGSLVREDFFHPRSDVDLAVWELAEESYYRAVGRLLALDPFIDLDLVRVETAPPGLRQVIEQEGVTL